jgi:hypothetical protein
LFSFFELGGVGQKGSKLLISVHCLMIFLSDYFMLPESRQFYMWKTKEKKVFLKNCARKKKKNNAFIKLKSKYLKLILPLIPR